MLIKKEKNHKHLNAIFTSQIFNSISFIQIRKQFFFLSNFLHFFGNRTYSETNCFNKIIFT